MNRNAGLIEELERRARTAATPAEALRLQEEAERLRLGQGTDEAPATHLADDRAHG